MTALLQRTGAPAASWLLALGMVCASAGLAAGISPKYGLAGALALAFVVAVFADLTVGVALFTALSFLDILNVGGAAVSFMKVAGLVLFVSWLATTATTRRQTTGALIARHPAMFVAIIAFVGWSAMSAVWAASPGDALVTAYRYILDLLLIPIVFSAVRDRKDVHMIVAAFVAGATISAVYGIIHPVPQGAAIAGRLAGALGEPNQEATVLVAAIVLSVGLATVIRRSPGWRLTAGIATIIMFVGLVDTLSRAGLISFAAVLVAGVVFGGRWRRSAALMLIAGVIGVVGYFAFIAPSSARQRVTSSDTSGRSDIWTVGWRMFEAHPLIGVGAGNFPVSSIHYLQRPGLITAAVYIVDIPKVAHNIYLEQLATLGIPGLIALIGIFVAGIAVALKAAHIFERIGDRELELLSRCVILALIAFLAADFFASELVSKQLWIVFALGPALLKLAHLQRQGARA